MITEAQERYIQKIPTNKMVEVYPWQPNGLIVAEKIINEIKSVDPDLPIVFIGSMPLKIAGQKDIDLSVVSPTENYPIHRANLEKAFGAPDKTTGTSIAWHFVREGFDVGIYLSDLLTSKLQEQIDVFELLKNNKGLLKEYENLKLEMNGKSYGDYQHKKYEFYNRILGIG